MAATPTATSRDLFHHWHTMEVRWGDMDAMGHVNNAAYFTYCESARMSYFEAVDLDAHREAASHGPALVTATCDFLRQVHYPATLEVGARVTEVSRRSFTLEYALYRLGTGELVATGSSVVVWVDFTTAKAIPLPDPLRAAIAAQEGEHGLEDRA